MNKHDYTKLFLQQAEIDPTEPIIKDYMRKWWVTPHSPVGLRLKSDGSHFLIQTLHLDYFSCKVTDNLQDNLKMILAINKRMTSPFYLSSSRSMSRTLICFGETDRIMLALYGGNLQQYIENFTR